MTPPRGARTVPDAVTLSGAQLELRPAFTRTLDRLADHAAVLDGIWKKDLAAGDWVIVRTRNSVYTLAALDQGRFAVTGGWFKTSGSESEPVRVCGCTWGGPAILTSLVAAPGMFLEFDNGVRTTRISDVRLIRRGDAASQQ